MSKISKFLSNLKDFNKEKQGYKQTYRENVAARMKERSMFIEYAVATAAATPSYPVTGPMPYPMSENYPSDNLLHFIDEWQAISAMQKSPEYKNIGTKIDQHCASYLDSRKKLLERTQIQMSNDGLPSFAYHALHLWETARLRFASNFMPGFQNGKRNYRTVNKESPSIYTTK